MNTPSDDNVPARWRERAESSERLHEAIESVRDLEGDERKRAIETAIRLALPFFDHWSYLTAKSNGDFTLEHREDIISIASMEMVKILSVEGMSKRAPSMWTPYLRRMMQNRAATFYTSSETSEFSGTVMLKRRKKTIARYTSELRFLIDRDPSAEEIMEYANDVISHSREDAQRQSALIVEQDFSPLPQSVFVDQDLDQDAHSGASVTESPEIHPIEGREIVKKVVETCSQKSNLHRDVAVLWIGDLYGADPLIRTASEITRELGRGSRDILLIETILLDVQETARAISTQQYGVGI